MAAKPKPMQVPNVRYVFRIVADKIDLDQGGKTSDLGRIEYEAAPVVAYHCESCDETSAEANEAPLYECSSCGEVYNRDNSADGSGFRCPGCGKFGSKVAATSCVECEGGPTEEVVRVLCPQCEEPIEEEDWPNHMLEQHGGDFSF